MNLLGIIGMWVGLSIILWAICKRPRRPAPLPTTTNPERPANSGLEQPFTLTNPFRVTLGEIRTYDRWGDVSPCNHVELDLSIMTTIPGPTKIEGIVCVTATNQIITDPAVSDEVSVAIPTVRTHNNQNVVPVTLRFSLRHDVCYDNLFITLAADTGCHSVIPLLRWPNHDIRHYNETDLRLWAQTPGG